jgi:transposase-like protein
MDAGEVRLAVGHKDTAPTILDEEMLKKLSINREFLVVPPPPDTFCKRGHNNWYLNPDERYRCKTCKQDYYQRNKEKILKRYADRRREAGFTIRMRKENA